MWVCLLRSRSLASSDVRLPCFITRAALKDGFSLVSLASFYLSLRRQVPSAQVQPWSGSDNGQVSTGVTYTHTHTHTNTHTHTHTHRMRCVLQCSDGESDTILFLHCELS